MGTDHDGKQKLDDWIQRAANPRHINLLSGELKGHEGRGT